MESMAIPGQPYGPGGALPNHRLATLVFLMAGTMLFIGLVGAYIVLRYGGPQWPPPGLPSLPIGLGTFNTAVILLSSVALMRGVRAMRHLNAGGLRRGLTIAAALGAVFVALQALQWSMLVGRGLSFAGTTYGSTFYVISGAHAVHALTGFIWLGVMALRQRQSSIADAMQRQIEVCALFWHFVGLVWVFLYVVLYLL
jgi:cytochrome c oxidase subunit 3